MQRITCDSSGNFFNANGTPFLVNGESAWLWYAQPTVADQTTYLTNRASKGINSIYVQAISRPTDHTAGSNSDGDFAFTTHTATTADMSTYNATYFNKLRDFIRLCASFNIYVWLSPCYLGFSGDINDGWATILAAQSPTVAAGYGTNIATTMINEPNIVWLIGGDDNPDATTLARQTSMVDAIKAVIPSAVFTGHWDQSAMPSSSFDSGIPFNDFGSGQRADSAYTWGVTYSQIEGVYGAGSPAGLLEGKYENNNAFGWTPLLIRQQFWNCFLSGGQYGNFYGNEQIWPAGSTNTNPQSGPNWFAHLGDLGITYQGYWYTQMIQRAWYKLIPDTGNQLFTAGRQTHGQNTYVTGAKTPDGKFACAYLSSTNGLTVDFTKMAGLTTARWFDPTNNTFTNVTGSPFPNTGSHVLTPPATNSTGDPDFALFLEVNTSLGRAFFEQQLGLQ